METRRSALTNRSEGESRQLAELSHFSKLAHALHLLAGELLGHLLHHIELLEQAVDVHDLSALAFMPGSIPAMSDREPMPLI